MAFDRSKFLAGAPETKTEEKPKEEARPGFDRAKFLSEPSTADKIKSFGGHMFENLDAARRGLEQLVPFADKIKGVGEAIETGVGNVVSGKPIGEGVGEAYDKRVAYERSEVDRLAKERPGSFYTTNIGGSILAPGLGAAVKGTSAVANAARTAAPVVEAGAIGLGNSRSDSAEGMLADAGSAAKFAGALGAGAAAAKKGVQYLSGGNVDKLKQRILNEFSEGSEVGAKRASPTQQAKLQKADEAILDEVIRGPDAKLVREASSVSAEDGRKILGPVINKVGASIGAGYDEFEAAAPQVKFNFDDNLLGAYLGRLDAVREEAVSSGKNRIVKGIDAFKDEIERFGQNNKGKAFDLRQLRGLTTEAQAAASSAIGSLNEHGNARLLRQIESAASEAMDDTLGAAVAGDARLQSVADKIRADNRRYFALKTIDDVLEFRGKREAAGASLLVRAADKLGSASVASGAVAGGMAAYNNPENAVENFAVGLGGGLALRGAGRAARAIDRGVTTRAIEAAQGRGPSSLITEASERLSRVAAQRSRREAQQPQDDDDKKRKRTGQ